MSSFLIVNLVASVLYPCANILVCLFCLHFPRGTASVIRKVSEVSKGVAKVSQLILPMEMFLLCRFGEQSESQSEIRSV